MSANRLQNVFLSYSVRKLAVFDSLFLSDVFIKFSFHIIIFWIYLSRYVIYFRCIPNWRNSWRKLRMITQWMASEEMINGEGNIINNIGSPSMLKVYPWSTYIFVLFEKACTFAKRRFCWNRLHFSLSYCCRIFS